MIELAGLSKPKLKAKQEVSTPNDDVTHLPAPSEATYIAVDAPRKGAPGVDFHIAPERRADALERWRMAVPLLSVRRS
jgi:hypothetical protein